MKHLAGCLPAIVPALAFAFLTTPPLQAETFKLDLQRLEDRPMYLAKGLDLTLRKTIPRGYWFSAHGSHQEPNLPDFDALINKEPRNYGAEPPLRFVVRFGTDYYALALGTSNPKLGYDRLWLDANRNGDLTDDKVFRSAPLEPGDRSRDVFANRWFPRIDITPRIDGQETEYSFFLCASRQIRGGAFHTNLYIYSGAVRQADVTLNGTPHRILLIDYDSSGRFNDAWEAPKALVNSRLLQIARDVLLVDPEASGPPSEGADLLNLPESQPVSRWVNIGGKYYTLAVAPRGESITLKPDDSPTGTIASPKIPLHALLFSDQAILRIRPDRNQPIPIPEGDWRLLSYRIDMTPRTAAQTMPAAERSSSDEPSEAKAPKKSPSHPPARTTAATPTPCPTYLVATGIRNGPVIKIRQGQNLTLPFGPPFKPIIITTVPETGTAFLEMRLVGKGKEMCTDLAVKGRRPDPPKFRITTAKGQAVAAGKFEWG